MRVRGVLILSVSTPNHCQFRPISGFFVFSSRRKNCNLICPDRPTRNYRRNVRTEPSIWTIDSFHDVNNFLNSLSIAFVDRFAFSKLQLCLLFHAFLVLFQQCCSTLVAPQVIQPIQVPRALFLDASFGYILFFSFRTAEPANLLQFPCPQQIVCSRCNNIHKLASLSCSCSFSLSFLQSRFCLQIWFEFSLGFVSCIKKTHDLCAIFVAAHFTCISL